MASFSGAVASAMAVSLGAACSAAAQNLIYFEEDGGGGNPRGLYTLNASTGVATLRATVGGTQRFFGMAVQPGTNTVYAVSVPGNTGLWTINVNTGATTFIGNTGVDTIADIHFHPTTGVLYGVQRNTPYGIYQINPSTAAATFVANTNDAARCGMVIDPTGQAYGFAVNGPMSTLNLATGATTPVGGGVVPSVVEDGCVTPGAFFFTIFSGSVYKVDPGTGANTLIHTSGMGSGLLGIIPEVASCYPDCDGNGSLTIADFGCFQTKFVQNDPYADCDGSGTLTIADFGCFQTKFVQGCP